jgi:hypothetical protein
VAGGQRGLGHRFGKGIVALRESSGDAGHASANKRKVAAASSADGTRGWPHSKARQEQDRDGAEKKLDLSRLPGEIPWDARLSLKRQ